jgi:hypothetical protein
MVARQKVLATPKVVRNTNKNNRSYMKVAKVARVASIFPPLRVYARLYM